MKTATKLTLTAFFMLASFAAVFAQDSTKKISPVRLLIGAALELGGDEVAEVYFTNGNKQSVKTGQGGSIAVGAQFQVPAVEKLLLRATVGFKYVTTEADNAHIRLTRIPLHFTANFMAARKLRLGAGLAMHRNIKFNADGIGPDIQFKGASGPIFEIAYSGVGLSYTAMNYKDEENHTYAANAVGLTFTFTLPNK